ncbi:TlpA family protein disulfide reductase [Parapedobacter tibetensis]|uniref:TlpA family protein disulfide reductase n=1 Tax=Parapedobacter tibetensis TaxID=2972951 RepID=UPI00214D30E6|nr:TlpA family protein disulfide reductase [Parapedobacter tibetensis]
MHVFTRTGQAMPKNIQTNSTHIKETGGAAPHRRKNHVFGSRAGFRVSGASLHGDTHASSLSGPILNHTKRPIPSLSFFAALLIGVTHASANVHPTDTTKIGIQALQIGDPIPEEVWNMPLQVVNHPEGKETITLADYKGKLILLDFWATWCSSCVAQFPKLEQLQQKHADSFNVLLVSNQREKEVLPYFERYKSRNNVKLALTSAIDAKNIETYFPFISVPHYAWIGSNGTVLAITGAAEIGTAQFSQLLRNRVPNIPTKKDIDTGKPLFMGDDLPLDQLQQYSIFIKGYHSGVGTGIGPRKTNGIVHGKYLSNYSIYNLYAVTVKEIFPDFNKARCVLEVEDTASIVISQSEPFNRDKYHSYELIVPVGIADSLHHIMLSELNRYTGYNGRIEKRKIRCLVIERNGTNTLASIETGGGQPIESLIKHWNWAKDNGTECYPEAIPLIDESHYTGLLPKEIVRITETERLNAALIPYGLKITEAERELDMFVLSDKNHR